MKPWDRAGGTTEATRLLRWIAALAETHARAYFDPETLASVVRSRRRIEDLISGVPAASIASSDTAEGLGLMLEIAALAAEPWGGDRIEGVSLAAEVLGRVGLVDLTVPASVPDMDDGTAGTEELPISPSESDARDPSAPSE